MEVHKHQDIHTIYCHTTIYVTVELTHTNICHWNTLIYTVLIVDFQYQPHTCKSLPTIKGRLGRMKRDSSIKDRYDKSRGIEILMSEAFAKINPTDPLILAQQVARRKRNWSDSSGISLGRCFFVVYYESIKRELKTRLIYEYLYYFIMNQEGES